MRLSGLKCDSRVDNYMIKKSMRNSKLIIFALLLTKIYSTMINLFNEDKIEILFRLNGLKIMEALDRVKNYPSVDADMISETIAQKFMIYVPQVNICNCKATSKLMDDNQWGTCKVAVVNYSIPYTGDGELFSFKPKLYGSSTYPTVINEKFIKFKIYTDYGQVEFNEETIKNVLNQVTAITDMIKYSLEQLEIDCNGYNLGLKMLVHTEITRRKTELQKSKDELDALNPY